MNTSSSTHSDGDFEDISSFSSIDSYKPEPFTGKLKDNKSDNEHELVSDGPALLKNDTLMKVETNGQDKTGDIQSRASSSTLRRNDSNAIEKVVTHNALNNNSETIESLQAKGLDINTKAIPDINAPMTHSHSEFPEEYQMETDTGLVKIKTIETLKRQDTRVSATRVSTKESNANSKPQEKGLNATKLNQAVEKNRKELEKYQRHKKEKGVKGFFHRLFD